MWVGTFTELRLTQFSRLLKAVRERGGNGTMQVFGVSSSTVYRVIQRQDVTVLGDGAYLNCGMVVPHRKRPRRALLAGEEPDNAAHRKVRARVEHVIGRMKNHKILRDCRQHGDGLHHAVRGILRTLV